MYGAILGDMIGAPYEFDRGNKTKDFPLFVPDSQFTDDTVMTIAVAEALLEAPEGAEESELRGGIIRSMHRWGQKYPNAGYGGRFLTWLRTQSRKPYGSYGNGSAMRVSSVGWLYDSLEETRRIARLTAAVTHNHPEGIKGAEAAASAIFLARTGSGKGEIREYIEREFGYDLSRTCDQIRPGYTHVESCQQTVPEAITAFLEGENFEDVIRTAVSLGGDCDTLTCIAGGIAEAFYDVPKELVNACRKRLPKEMLSVLDTFDERRPARDLSLAGNEIIEDAISIYCLERTEKNQDAVLHAVFRRTHEKGHFLIPCVSSEDGKELLYRFVRAEDGTEYLAAFTSEAEFQKGGKSQVYSGLMRGLMKDILEKGAPGLILNPWGQSFTLNRELIGVILEAEEGIEYTVREEVITPDLLKDGSYLKRAVGTCIRNRTSLNMIRLFRILRDSWIWIPCSAVMSERDSLAWEKILRDAEQSGGLDSLVGMKMTSQDEIRMVPDILQNGEGLFFPVFTSAEEMGEYGEQFSKIEKHFLEAIHLARNNEKKLLGIVINAFSEPFVIPAELFDLIEKMHSSFESGEEKP